MKRAPLPPVLIFLVLFAASCRDSEIAAYRIPKENETPLASPPSPHAAAPAGPVAPTPGAGAMPAIPMATAAGPGLVWTAPVHWQPKPPSAMRKGSYSIKGDDASVADLSVTAFPGDVGGENANINRWRGQLQLPPLGETEIVASVTRLEANGLKIALVDFANPSAATPTRLVGAMVPFGGSTWFFKMLGPESVVAREKAAFLEFLKTIQSAAAAPVSP